MKLLTSYLWRSSTSFEKVIIIDSFNLNGNEWTSEFEHHLKRNSFPGNLFYTTFNVQRWLQLNFFWHFPVPIPLCTYGQRHVNLDFAILEYNHMRKQLTIYAWSLLIAITKINRIWNFFSPWLEWGHVISRWTQRIY